MSRWSGLKRRLGMALEIPQNTLLNVPRVTMIGAYQVYIENQRGVLEFTSERLRLRLVAGQLQITGKGLVIRQISGEEIFVEGEQIGSLTFID